MEVSDVMELLQIQKMLSCLAAMIISVQLGWTTPAFALQQLTLGRLRERAANLCGLAHSTLPILCHDAQSPAGEDSGALLIFQGHGAAAARKKFFGPQSDSSLPVLLEGGVQRVQVVASYVHLGSPPAPSGGHATRKHAADSASPREPFNITGKSFTRTNS